MNILVTRIEQHQIKKSHPMYKTIDDLCFKSKNLYNYANYIIRQEFIDNGKYIKVNDLDKMLQDHETYKELGSQASQKTLQLLDKNWKSFFMAIKDWKRNKSKYFAKPNLPRYKHKDGRYIVMLKNIQFRTKEGYIYFSWKPLKPFNNMFRTNIKGKLLQLRFVPKGSCYMLEIVYEKEVPELKYNSSHIAAIDLGIDNFVTLVNNIGEKPIVINGKGIKSYNQYWNKEMTKYRGILKKENGRDWSRRLDTLTLKRNNKLNYFMHKASKWVIDYCKTFNIDTLVVGHNSEWKQDCKLSKTTQTFVQIPYNNFIQKLKYKCEDAGIRFIETEESYTSGTSFLDNEEPIKENYNNSRRKHRGLFKSNNGTLINADVNGAYQIMKKVFPNAFANEIVGADLHPIVINL